MCTYLLTKDVLNVSVSRFTNYDTPTNPVTINLTDWLTSNANQAEIEVLRLVEDKADRNAIKATLPAITPSGIFTYRKESNMVSGSHTRLIQFDIDQKDNTRIRNYADLKTQISKLPFVAYCGLSASGNGFWGLVPINNPERHSQHFDALVRVFASYRIKIDTKPRNTASLRGYSYDPAPYIPERVMVFELKDEPKKAKPRPFILSTDANDKRQQVEACIQEILWQKSYIGNSYEEWYMVGCALANTFEGSGRDYFHQISQHYPGYDTQLTDKQFTACLKEESKATLGTFFHLCNQAGILWKRLVPPKQLNQHRKPDVKTIAKQLVCPGSVLKPDESQIERLVIEQASGYLPEWDEPNPPNTVSSIRVKPFHEWQCNDRYFSQLGVNSLENYIPYENKK